MGEAKTSSSFFATNRRQALEYSFSEREGSSIGRSGKLEPGCSKL